MKRFDVHSFRFRLWAALVGFAVLVCGLMWVVQITTLSRATVAITFRSRTRSLGSSPAVGSSRSSSLGSFSRAWAMPSRWRMPPENSPILRLLSSRRFTVSKSRSTVASSSRWLSFIPLTAAMYRRNSSARKDL